MRISPLVLKMSEHVPQAMKFYCEKCDRSFENRPSLIQHVVATGHGYQCEHCTKMFAAEKSLSQHFEARHKKPECKYCGKVVSSVKGLRSHVRSKHLVLKCEECRKKFAEEKELTSHVLNNHRKRCRKCNEYFKVHEIISHQRVEHNICPCGEEFPDSDQLREHVYSVHSSSQ